MAPLQSLFTALLALAPSAWAAKSHGKPTRVHVPGAYIFEFEDGHDTADFYTKVGSEGTTRVKLDYKLFKGVSVQLHDIENAETKAASIASSASVKNMWPVELYEIPRPIVNSIGEPSTQAAGLDKRDNETTAYSPHLMTQIDKLHKEGVTGKGIKIAVVDTGIDYNHPALGGCFGENCHVSFGTDIVGDDYDGYNTPVPDDDPMDCFGHGTHVAGIVAALENEYGFIGGAPDATLGAYRVFGCDGSAGNDVLIAAFNQAFEDGADIITASIGGPSGWADEAWSAAVAAIVEQGVPCTISAGNDGDLGMFFASTASGGRGVASIASFDNTESPTLLYLSKFSVDGGESQDFGYSAGSPSAWNDISLPLWAADFDPTVPNGGCDPYPEDTPDLSKYIVLVRRGSCTYTQKAQNAAKFGAKYLIVYNNVGGAVQIDIGAVPGMVAGGMVTADVGKAWLELLEAGSEVVLTVTNPEDAETTLVHPINSASGGALSTYTTWGPMWDLEELKPSFGAPGGNILSTYPLALGSYAVLSGTSMACPLAAAAYALISEVRGTLDPAEIRNAIASTGNPQLFNDGASFYSFLAPVPQQGAGLIQAYDAAHAKAIIEPSGLSFGDSATFSKVLNFTITNTGDKEVTYEVSHVPTVSMYTLDTGSIYPAAFPNEANDAAAKLSFSETKITVGSGESVFIDVMPKAPRGLDASRLPVWSGFVAVNGSDGTSLSLPYQGVSGSLHKHTVLDSESAWIALSTDESYAPIASNTTFTLPAPGSDSSEAVLPLVAAQLALGSTTLRADVVPLFKVRNRRLSNFFRTKTLGQVKGFPLKYVGRDMNVGAWDGQLDNGLYAPPGKYKIVVRALRIQGNARKQKDWDVAESEPFTIQYE